MEEASGGAMDCESPTTSKNLKRTNAFGDRSGLSPGQGCRGGANAAPKQSALETSPGALRQALPTSGATEGAALAEPLRPRVIKTEEFAEMFANQLLLATDNFEYVIWDTEGIMRMGSHVGMTVAAVSELDGLRAQMPRSWEHGLVHVRVVDGKHTIVQTVSIHREVYSSALDDLKLDPTAMDIARGSLAKSVRNLAKVAGYTTPLEDATQNQVLSDVTLRGIYSAARARTDDRGEFRVQRCDKVVERIVMLNPEHPDLHLYTVVTDLVESVETRTGSICAIVAWAQFFRTKLEKCDATPWSQASDVEPLLLAHDISGCLPGGGDGAAVTGTKIAEDFLHWQCRNQTQPGSLVDFRTHRRPRYLDGKHVVMNLLGVDFFKDFGRAQDVLLTLCLQQGLVDPSHFLEGSFDPDDIDWDLVRKRAHKAVADCRGLLDLLLAARRKALGSDGVPGN